MMEGVLQSPPLQWGRQWGAGELNGLTPASHPCHHPAPTIFSPVPSVPALATTSLLPAACPHSTYPVAPAHETHGCSGPSLPPPPTCTQIQDGAPLPYVKGGGKT